MFSECLLATLSADHADERIQVLVSRDDHGGSTISLVQQSWAESLGWYTQQVMKLTPEQVGQLRLALGAPGAGKTAGSIVRERYAVTPSEVACVPFPSLQRRAHSA
jgi:hypothetical protein